MRPTIWDSTTTHSNPVTLPYLTRLVHARLTSTDKEDNLLGYLVLCMQFVYYAFSYVIIKNWILDFGYLNECRFSLDV